MSKNYLCKDCNYNNNGWCKKRKIQGLKSILECEFKDYTNEETEGNLEENHTHINSTEEKEEADYTPYTIYGKREMLYNISMQVVGMEMQGVKTIQIDDLKQLLLSIGQVLDVEQQIFGINTNYIVEEDVVNNCKKLFDNWKTQLNTDK